jgi:hypothetical protein
MNSAGPLLSEFENRLADEFPVGEEGGEVLDQLERIGKLVEEAKAFYKDALTKDPGCVPGWGLRPGAMRRTLGDPAKVWDRVSTTLSSQQFMEAVEVRILRLQEIWAKAAGVPACKARAAFDEHLGNLVQTWPSAPTLVRAK